jgi:ribonuclease VapC
MILDSSAVIAAICREPEAERILETLNSAKLVAIGAPTLAETHLALSVKLGRDASAPIEQFLQACQAMVIPFGREHVPVFFHAWLRFGKGRHQPASTWVIASPMPLRALRACPFYLLATISI